MLIDEFQDFSEGFYRLSQGMRAANPEVEFFCVGDDWQAINGFAGSEIRFFDEFDRYLSNPAKRVIRSNYRSKSAIVQAGNALMAGKGEPAVASSHEQGRVLVGESGQFTPTEIEQSRHQGDDITPAVLRVVSWLLRDDLDVVVLSRRNGLPWYVTTASTRTTGPPGLEGFVDRIRSFLPEEDQDRVTISTTHKYKGLEKAAVVVVDALRGCLPLDSPELGVPSSLRG